MQGLIQPGAPFDAFNQVTDQQIESIADLQHHARVANTRLSEMLSRLTARDRAAAQVVLLESFKMTCGYLDWTLQLRERLRDRRAS